MDLLTGEKIYNAKIIIAALVLIVASGVHYLTGLEPSIIFNVIYALGGAIFGSGFQAIVDGVRKRVVDNDDEDDGENDLIE